MEDIIAYSIIASFPVVVIFGAVLLRRYFVRSRARKVTQIEQRWEQVDKEAARDRQSYQQQQKDDRLLAQARSEEAVQLRDRAERERIKGMQNVTPTYRNLGNAGAQRYDTKTGTIQTAVYDNTTNDTQWRTLGGSGGNTSVQTALGGSGGTTSAQPVAKSSTDLFTGMAIGSLVNSLFSSPSYSRPSSDDSSSQKSSSSSWSDSSSSDSSSSDSGPSSDW